MSENQNENDNEQNDSPNFKRLREKLEAVEAEKAQLRKVAAQNMVQVAGYDPEHPTTSLVLDQYLGNEEADLTPNAFRTFAERYDLPTVSSSTLDGDGGDEAPDHSGSFDALQSGADELRRATQQAAGEPSVDERIAQAEASGDFDASMALKSQRLGSQMLNIALGKE